jgi:AcrR family transcriptional regulator
MAKDEAPALSRAMRELWGRADDGRRGPKPAASVRSVAAAGVEIADADGVAAVTMAAVASRLGFTTMALYRYVESRQDLLVAMVDEAFGAPPEPNRRRGWRGQVEAWARADAGRLFAHPWVLDVRLGSPPVGPNLLAWMEAGFAALAASGLPPGRVADSLLIVDGYVRSSVQLAVQYADGADEWVRTLRTVLDADRFPQVHDVLQSGAFDDDSLSGAPSGSFEFGLSLVLDGIDRLVPARTRR